MLYTIIIMIERLTSVEWRVNVNTVDFSSKFLFERFKREEVVTKNEAIIEDVVVSYALLSVIRLLGIFQQDTGLQLGSISFANPRQFQFLLAVSRHLRIVLSDITRRR
jgi:hypothetical protein